MFKPPRNSRPQTINHAQRTPERGRNAQQTRIEPLNYLLQQTAKAATHSNQNHRLPQKQQQQQTAHCNVFERKAATKTTSTTASALGGICVPETSVQNATAGRTGKDQQFNNLNATTTTSATSNHSNPNKSSQNEISKLWIHCNYCYEPYIKKRRPMFLLSCHHILCSNCLTEVPNFAQINNTTTAPGYKCKICEKIVRIRQIGNDMPTHLKELFHPEPWANKDSEMIRMVNFQKFHREHLKKTMLSFPKNIRKLEEKLNETCRLLDDALEKNRNLKIEMSRHLSRIREIAVLREREKNENQERELKRRQQEQNEPTLLSQLVSESSIGVVSCSGAQRCREIIGQKGRSPGKYNLKRNFVRQLMPPKQPEVVPFPVQTTNLPFDL